jgi:hypothetical protein
MQTKSDYLDASNPYLLRAFFQFCDIANNATFAASNSDIDEPRLRRLAISMILSVRQQSLMRLFTLFGGEFKASFPSSWPKR